MSGDRFTALAAAPIRALKAYDPGHDILALRARFADRGLTELGSNENSLGPSPLVAAALQAQLADLYRYPDPLGGRLKQALSALHGVAPAQIVLGNGSHELLMQLAQVFAGAGDEVLMSQYGFAVYAIAAAAVGASVVQAPALPADAAMALGHDLEAIAAAVGPRTRLIYLCNPNNPTGTWFPRADLAAFLDGLAHEVVVVVDEAYQEYVDEPDAGSALALLPRHPRLLVARTFSKAYGLAGLRAGYVVGHPELVALIERVRESFNLNLFALAGAEAAIGDQAHIARVCRANACERDWLADELRARGFATANSQTNFVLSRFGARCAAIEAGLLERGVVLRPMRGYGLPEYLRITVGQRDENLRLLAALDTVLAAC